MGHKTTDQTNTKARASITSLGTDFDTIIFTFDFSLFSVFCSETNGGLETLTAEVKDQLKKQRRRFKKYWPCFKGILSPIKGFVINLDVCTGNPYSEGRAIVQEMSDLFLEKELTLTQILRHITNKISPPLGYSGTFFSTWANVLTRMADTVEKMTLDELEDMLGCKCFRRLSRPCF